jgi:hypothetical protein
MILDQGLIKNIYSFLYSLIVGSGIVIFMTTGQTDSTSVNAFRSAYMILLCVFIFICVLIGLNTNFGDSSIPMKVFKFMYLFYPFLAVMVIILWILVLLYKYYDKIIGNKVSDYYTSFMNVTSILLFIQIYVLISEITDKSFGGFSLSPKMASMLRLFALLNGISVITLGIVLKYYTTDC